MFAHSLLVHLYTRRKVVLYLLVCVLTGCLAPVRAVPTPTPWPTPTVSARTTFTVQRGTLIDEVQFNGEVTPQVWEALTFPVAGTLGTLHKLQGEMVSADDLLAELEMPDLLEQLEQAQVALAQAQDAQTANENERKFAHERAQLELRKAELLLERARKGNDPTEVQLQEVQVQLAQLALQEIDARANPALARTVTKAQLAVEALQRQVEERQLRAPYAGQLIALGVGLQELRSQPDKLQPHTPIPAYAPVMIVAQPEPLIVVVKGDAPRVSELTVGQRLTMTHYLVRDKPFAGEVIALPSQNSSPTKQPGFEDKLQIAVPANHPPMKIGDTVQVRALIAIHANTLMLPNAAVRRFAGRTFVVVETGERQRRLDIQVGLETDGQVEVLAGLNEGDVVIGP